MSSSRPGEGEWTDEEEEEDTLQGALRQRRGDQDNDFEMGDEEGSEGRGVGRRREAGGVVSESRHRDKPYDEAIEVEDQSDSGLSTPRSGAVSAGQERPPTQPASRNPAMPPSKTDSESTGKKDHDSGGLFGPGGERGGVRPGGLAKRETDEDEESEEETSEEDEEAPPIQGGYNPSDYANLDVSSEVKELFNYIRRYKPHSIELETKLKPFIPDFIPAVGEVDAFIKIPRPDGKDDGLGLVKLDEPALNQSDPPVLELKLRSISKQTNLQPMEIRSIESAEKNPKEIANWIARISDLHRTRPPPTVQYTRRMPDIERLMQEWPTDFEDFLKSPSPDGTSSVLEYLNLADLDMPMQDYVRLLCGILDIPCYTNLVESLHVLLTLYMEFRDNPHFKPQDVLGDNLPGMRGPSPASASHTHSSPFQSHTQGFM